MEASRVSRPKKARQVRSKIKVMLTVFFDVRGIVHHKYAPEGQMVTKEYYHDVLRRLRDAVRRKRQDMWTANNWHLHHDNAPAHSSQLIHTFLAKHGITTVHQPPYSPDLAPCDFWLFPKLKTPLKGSHFESREEIMRNATTELNTIPKEDFQRCFRQWKDRWAKCVQAQGPTLKGIRVPTPSEILHHHMMKNEWNREKFSPAPGFEPGFSLYETEDFLSNLVVNKTVLAKTDRPAGVVSFTQSKDPNDVLNDWSNHLSSLMQLVNKTTHLINKEEMVHKHLLAVRE
ncbi:hypothetical protein ANN_06436 [Periplaneta americana]|uniref:26S proteasome regulatory subunit RPN5 C-terminal domain-containing protein n=1 Tax=Periplaneta americana TaxID=6978 RepID=A0ABQ8TDQ2_PERAM|nr:hypothetical protein ANN_06436 [Periplaneta americana]